MNKKSSVAIAEPKRETALPTVAPNQYPAFAALLQSGGESIATFASNCTTPKTDFDLGETVCIKVTGASAGSKRVNWASRTDAVVQWDDLSLTGPNTFTYTLPATITATLSGTTLGTITDDSGTRGIDDVTVDNRGVWRVFTAAPDNSVRTVAFFTVHAPTPFVDVSVYQSAGLQATSVSAGSSSALDIYVTNNGPDAAQNVQLIDTLPDNISSASLADGSSTFNCGTATAGTITCTASSLPAGTTKKLALIYEVAAGTPANTVLTNNVSVTSTTPELEPGDNSSAFNSKVPASAGAETCSLNCRDNLVVTANTSQGGTPGAIVNFTATNSIVGNCGAISTNPASGTFFPVGTTVVSVSSADGGGSCSFTVTVTDTADPTISCPVDKSAPADQNGTATVDPGTPATTPSTGTTVAGVRTDGLNLTDPYPVGNTFITWTVTDSIGRTASCRQKIMVTSVCAGDTTPPTITAPANITVGTGADSPSCTVTLDDELGAPIADDDCSVTVTTSGIPAGNLFPVGQTIITYTATDGSGHTASATQTVTVVDDTPPVIFAPADATYTCPSEVPAANASQATGPDVIVNSQAQPGPVTDNCTAVTVTVAEIRSGAGSASNPLIITRTFTATDAAAGHNSASAVQTITVADGTPPSITGPADVVIGTGPNATSCGITISNLDAALGTASASDNCATATVARSGVPAGNTFPLGDTTVTYTATDAAGNTASTTQKVTVVDDTPPTITAPADTTVNANTGSCSATGVVLGTPTTADNCSVASVTNNAPSVFPLGDTTVTWTVTDGAGHTATAAQKVTVVDTQDPTITAPAAKTFYTGANATSCDVTVTDLDATLGTATASDNCSVASVIRSGVPAGGVFPKGTTTITYTATDGSGNTKSATQTVTVVDNTAPVITVAGANPMTVECHTSFTDPGATASDNCDASVAVSASGSVNVNVPGTYTITYSAHDVAGNTATSQTRTVNVVDTTPPTITLKSQTISLWPPNHKYKTINVTDLVQSASDGCDESVGINDVVITKVTSDETENGNGDGNTTNDIVIASNCKSVQLRSERDGGGDGRVYTVYLRLKDATGNTTTVTKTVVVPTNQGSNGSAIDSGPHYTVTSSCP